MTRLRLSVGVVALIVAGWCVYAALLPERTLIVHNVSNQTLEHLSIKLGARAFDVTGDLRPGEVGVVSFRARWERGFTFVDQRGGEEQLLGECGYAGGITADAYLVDVSESAVSCKRVRRLR